MISQSIAVLCLSVVCFAQSPSNQYLPPDKGYSYEPPKVPFPPPPPVSRPPPVPTPTPPGTYGPPPVGPPAPPNLPTGPGGPYPPAGAPSEGKPVGVYGPDSHLNMPHVPGMPYEFDYAVNDPVHMAFYSHNAKSDGDQVKGEYRIQLPDGRTQIVSYVADWATGFHADVKYEGEATYPAPSPGGGLYPPAGAPSAPAPATGPAPGGYPTGPAPGGYPSGPAPGGDQGFTGYPAAGAPPGATGGGY